MKDLEIRRAGAGDRQPLARMLELYQYELSDIWDQDLDDAGLYGYDLDRYWRDARALPFVVLVGGHHAGFALVDDAVKLGPDGNWMDQFFVLKKYRRQGLGRTLAVAVFDQVPGPWEVGQMPENLPAQAFWRRVIGDYSRGDYTEQRLTDGWWQGFVQRFGA